MARFWAVAVFIAVVVGSAMGNTHAECDACTFLVDVAAPFVENSDDEQLVVDALEKACEFLPSGAERLCDDVAVLAVNFTRLLLGQNETSVEVCNDLNFCAVCCDEDAPSQVHIAYGNDPSTSMTAAWATSAGSPAEAQRVAYGLTPATMTETCAASSYTYTAGGWDGALHNCTMGPLEPSTRYYYKVGRDGGLEVGPFWFTTAPAPRTSDWDPLRVVVLGDMGYRNSEKTIARVAAIANEAKAGGDPLTFVLHNGDESYANGRQHLWDVYMDEVASPFASFFPYMMSVGNHETYFNFSAYKARFRMPDASPGAYENFWYSYDVGPVHFLVFSTEHSVASNSTQYAFMQADLAAADANRDTTPWIVTYAHRPLYCSEDFNDHTDCFVNAPKLRAALEPLFLKHHVDLHLEAHEHAYERMYPVYNVTEVVKSYHNPPYPVYVMNGAAGGPEGLDRHTKKGVGYSAFFASTYGFGILETGGADWLSWQFVEDDSGDVIDAFNITRS